MPNARKRSAEYGNYLYEFLFFLLVSNCHCLVYAKSVGVGNYLESGASLFHRPLG